MSLPVQYNLAFDIDTLEELRREYWLARDRVKAMESMARVDGIDLGACAPWAECWVCEANVELNENMHCADCAANAAMLASDSE